MGFRDVAAGCVSANDFAARLVAGISPDEWHWLETGDTAGRVSAFNRAVLLRLRECAPGVVADGPFDSGGAGRMAGMLQDFLDQYMADAPDDHRWIIASCLALAFVFREPLHPVEVVKAETRIADGATTYFCPAREGDDTLCGFCVCHPIAELADA